MAKQFLITFSILLALTPQLIAGNTGIESQAKEIQNVVNALEAIRKTAAENNLKGFLDLKKNNENKALQLIHQHILSKNKVNGIDGKGMLAYMILITYQHLDKYSDFLKSLSDYQKKYGSYRLKTVLDILKEISPQYGRLATSQILPKEVKIKKKAIINGENNIIRQPEKRVSTVANKVPQLAVNNSVIESRPVVNTNNVGSEKIIGHSLVPQDSKKIVGHSLVPSSKIKIVGHSLIS